MAQKTDTVQLKSTHLMALLFVLGLVIGVLAGYYFGVRSFDKLQAGPVSGGAEDSAGNNILGGVTKEGLFSTYADDLKLNKKNFNSCLNNQKYKADVEADLQTALSVGAQGTPTFVVNGQVVPIGASPYSEFKKIFDAELANPTNRSFALSLMKPNDPTLGKKDAPIVFIEFSDFQCPFCGRFYIDTEGKIIKDYVDTGKVLFVYKDFPLKQIHALAQKAAEAANCANDQGKFWEYHDKLFDNQVQWAR